jgi:hypothetical protein
MALDLRRVHVRLPSLSSRFEQLKTSLKILGEPHPPENKDEQIPARLGQSDTTLVPTPGTRLPSSPPTVGWARKMGGESTVVSNQSCNYSGNPVGDVLQAGSRPLTTTPPSGEMWGPGGRIITPIEQMEAGERLQVRLQVLQDRAGGGWRPGVEGGPGAPRDTRLRERDIGSSLRANIQDPGD